MTGGWRDERSTKKCTKCGETKSLEGFYKKHNTKDGRQYRCKACDRICSGQNSKEKEVEKWARMTDRFQKRTYGRENRASIMESIMEDVCGISDQDLIDKTVREAGI
ncbi:hypothetical protein IID24_03335 [Patescibacteria group bacterium]|nr:hypothetical protein [Patescibacteria group bacterium]